MSYAKIFQHDCLKLLQSIQQNIDKHYSKVRIFFHEDEGPSSQFLLMLDTVAHQNPRTTPSGEK